MFGGIQAFIEKFKNDKLSAILAFLFLAAFAVSNNADLLNGFPDPWEGPIASICGIVKAVAIAYGIIFSSWTINPKELEDKLKTIQKDPEQTVIMPKVVVEAAPALKEVADSHEILKQVAEVVPQIQKIVAIQPVITDLVKKTRD